MNSSIETYKIFSHVYDLYVGEFNSRALEGILKAAGFRSIEFAYNYDYHGFTGMIDEAKLKTNYIVKAMK